MLIVSDPRCERATDPSASARPRRVSRGSSATRSATSARHTERNQRQTAHQVIAALSPVALVDGATDLLWDSGKVASANSVSVEWSGPRLHCRERVCWRVRCWDAQEDDSVVFRTRSRAYQLLVE